MEKVSNIAKKINIELIYNKKYLKAEKISTSWKNILQQKNRYKRRLSMFLRMNNIGWVNL